MKVRHRAIVRGLQIGQPVSVVRWIGNTPELVDGHYVGQNNGYWQIDAQGELLAFPTDQWELCIA